MGGVARQDRLERALCLKMATKDSVLTTRPIFQELFDSSVYKRNQGRMVRQITCVVIWLVVVFGTWRFHSLMLAKWFGGSALSYLLAVFLGAVGLWIGFRLVNWPKFADFLISVEAELNKVSWPSWRELYRAAMVVIFTIFFMATVLFMYDIVWTKIFEALKIH